jgi:hypothetical protein
MHSAKHVQYAVRDQRSPVNQATKLIIGTCEELLLKAERPRRVFSLPDRTEYVRYGM